MTILSPVRYDPAPLANLPSSYGSDIDLSLSTYVMDSSDEDILLAQKLIKMAGDGKLSDLTDVFMTSEAQGLIVRVKPLGHLQVLALRSADADLYLALCDRKTSDVKFDNGIGSFETEYLTGIIRYGQRLTPQFISAIVWSKEHQLIQEFVVLSQDAATSEDCLKRVLASYEFRSTALPQEPEDVAKLVEQSLRDQGLLKNPTQ